MNQDQKNSLNTRADNLDDLNKEYQEFIKMNTDTGGILSTTSTSILSNPSRIRNLFRDPESNAVDIANAMVELWKTNGIVNGTIRYFQSHLTLNHSIYPTLNERSGYEMSGESQEYIEAANFVDRFNIKYYVPYFIQQMLLKGVVYLYEFSDRNSVGYMEFPTSWCRVRKMDNNLLRWEVDMSQISENSDVFPREIQSAYEKYNGQGTPEGNSWTDGQWYMPSDRAFALTLDHNIMSHGVAVSELASILLDSSALENAKNNIEIKDSLDTVKIIHSKVPTDNTGKIKINAKLASMYNDQINRALPRGIVSIASPMDMNNISISGAGDRSAYEMVEKAQDQLFLSTGTPANLFGAKTTSSRIVDVSIQKDATWLYTSVLPTLENYYNYRLSKFRTQSNMVWKIKFIRQSYYSLKDDIARVQQQLDRGGSRLDYLAATGMLPSEIIGKLRLEQEILDIDSLMIPKQTSHTMSSSGGSPPDGVENRGRPETDRPTEDTERIRDSQ